jgi:hypothetical protein
MFQSVQPPTKLFRSYKTKMCRAFKLARPDHTKQTHRTRTYKTNVQAIQTHRIRSYKTNVQAIQTHRTRSAEKAVSGNLTAK